MTSTWEALPGERPNISSVVEDTSTRSTVSSSTTLVWRRVVAHILIVKGLFSADGPRMVRHNPVPQARTRESSANCSRCSISEDTSHRVPSAEEQDKL
jgi:hypothetical protein